MLKPPAEVYDDITFLETQPPELPTESQWYSQTSYDDAGRPSRQRFFGLQDPDAPSSPGFLQAAWMQYDSAGRPTASHVAVHSGYVPTSVADLETPPTNPLTVARAEIFYNAAGKRSKTVDPKGRPTDYEYDSFGRPWKTRLPPTDGDRDTSETLYDIFGRPRSTTVTLYDPNHSAHVRVREVAYDTWGRVWHTVGDPGGNDLITESEFDGLGRTIRQIRRWAVTPATLPLAAIASEDQVVEAEFDAAGRLTEQRIRESATPEIWAVTSVTYDNDGLASSMTDAEGNRTDYEYDGLGQLERMLYPVQGGARQTIEYAAYNLRGQPTEVQYRKAITDTGPRVTRTMEYDNYGRLTSRTAEVENGDGTEFSGTTTQFFGYDDLGRVVHATDHSPDFGNEQDIQTHFWYDSASRLGKENQRHPINDQFFNHSVVSTFDVAGFRTNLVFPDPNYGIQYVSDDRGRLKTIRAPTDPEDMEEPTLADLVGYQYVGGQPWRREYRNGTELKFDDGAGHALYDGLGRPTGMRTTATTPGTWTGGALPDFRYGYDRVGNLIYEQRRHESIQSSPPKYRTRAYGTDRMGRLREWAEGPLAADPLAPDTTDPVAALSVESDGESWLLDLVGNWDAKTTGIAPSQTTDDYQINALNQYTKVGADPNDPVFAHDWLGQLREDESKNKKYTWDLFGRLTEVTAEIPGTCNAGGHCDYDPEIECPNGPSDCVHDSMQSRYRYDAFNRRVETYIPSPGTATDSTTRYVYDGWRVIEEHAVNGSAETVRARYGHGIGLDEVLWMDRDVPMDGAQYDPIGGSPDGTVESRFFIHHDLLGSAVAVTDDVAPNVAKVVERFTYSAYGEVQAWGDPIWDGATYGAASTRSKVGLPFLYTGQRYEPVTELHYYKNRQYDPTTGRFLRRDLIGYADGPSLYQYAGSNPSRFSDPLGLRSVPALNTRLRIATEAGLIQFKSFWVPPPPAPPKAKKGKKPKLKQPPGNWPPRPEYIEDKVEVCLGLGVQWKTCQEKREYEARWANKQGWPHIEPQPPKQTAWGLALDCEADECVDVIGNDPGADGDGFHRENIEARNAFLRRGATVAREAGLFFCGFFDPCDWAQIGIDVYRNGLHWTHAVALLPGVPARAGKWARQGIDATIDPATGRQVGRFIGRENGSPMIEPVGGSTVPAGSGGIDTHTLYPNGSNYQRLNPQGHPGNPTPHAHGHLEGTGPGMAGQGPSIDPQGNVVPWASPAAHWP